MVILNDSILNIETSKLRNELSFITWYTVSEAQVVYILQCEIGKVKLGLSS